jgi:uncharacterized repeat protein (TIGR03806 family)
MFDYNSCSLFGILALLLGCTSGLSVQLDEASPPFEQLSEYQFFRGDLKQLMPNEGVLPYNLITPLFSDYAEKARFVWLPPGTQARFENIDESLVFPIGSVLIKNFYYFNDARAPEEGKQLVETRLLVNRKNGWDALTYVWDGQQAEAYLEIAGDIRKVDWIDHRGEPKNTTFIIPNKNQCKGCHEYKKELQPIGPKVRHLNKVYNYRDGPMNQLEKWQQVGYLEPIEHDPADLPKVALWNDKKAILSDRALAYMEINCGICHGEHGPANISGLFLTTLTKDLNHLGFCKSPVSAGSGSGGRQYDIVPGNPDASILIYRMESLNPGEMMPELGRTMVHEEGVELIRDWISSLEGACPDAL